MKYLPQNMKKKIDFRGHGHSYHQLCRAKQYLWDLVQESDDRSKPLIENRRAEHS